MRPARVRAFAILSVVMIAAGIAVAVVGRQPRALPPRAESQRPALLLLTSLPLVFPEQFTLTSAGSPALSALAARYRIVPISITDQAELAKGRLLLMAHPPVQTAENLVALDNWVRGGGRLLLLADPLSEWPSKRPLGDPLRPSPMFMDTGLLAHWRLRLDTPEERGRVRRKLAGYDVLTDSPGTLSGACAIGGDGLVAHCAIGRGRATIVADSDFVDAERFGQRGRHNLDALVAELAALEKR